MTDIDRGHIGGGDEDRLPWLEPVEDEQPEGGVAAGKLIAAVVVALLALGLIVGGLFWLRERGTSEVAGGSGDLIQAPPGDYKVAPSDPGGMNVAGEGDATFAASQGVPVDAAIDISKQPEAPVAGQRAPQPATAPVAPVKTVPLPASTAAPAPTVAAAPVTPPVTKPAAPVSAPTPPKPAEVKRPVEVASKPEPAKPAVAASGGPAVQLGAFGSEAKAQAAWSGLAGRFPALKSLSHSVTLAEVGGKKLYRLRATAGSRDKAATVCRALSHAKEACNVVG